MKADPVDAVPAEPQQGARAGIWQIETVREVLVKTIDGNESNEAEFTSWQSYWAYAKEVRRGRRYVWSANVLIHHLSRDVDIHT